MAFSVGIAVKEVLMFLKHVYMPDTNDKISIGTSGKNPNKIVNAHYTFSIFQASHNNATSCCHSLLLLTEITVLPAISDIV